MDRTELAHAVHEMRDSAGDYVTAYARLYCRHVRTPFLIAIVEALGDISIVEAIGALDRLEAAALDRLEAES